MTYEDLTDKDWIRLENIFDLNVKAVAPGWLKRSSIASNVDFLSSLGAPFKEIPLLIVGASYIERSVLTFRLEKGS